MTDIPSDNVVPFRPRLVKDDRSRAEPRVAQPAIVEMLQRVLSDALAGQVQSLALVYVDDGGDVQSGSCAQTDTDVATLIGGMSHLTHRLNRSILGG